MEETGIKIILEAQVAQATTAVANFATAINQLTSIVTQAASRMSTALGAVSTSGSQSLGQLSSQSAVAAAGITNLADAVNRGVASFVGFSSASNTLAATAQAAASLGSTFGNLAPVTGAAAAGITNLFQAVASGETTFVRTQRSFNNYMDAITGVNRANAIAVDSLNRLSPVTGAAAAGITNLTRAVNSGQAALQGQSVLAQYAVSANARLATSTQNLIRPTANATGALSGFTNIIRDAPYGIIGVGNNITQVVDGFGQLTRATGSVSGALSAMIGSIFSPAGIFTLGVSTAVSLWTVYAQRQQRAASEAKKAADQIKTLGQLTKDAAVSSNQYQASAAGEVATLNRLFEIAKDENNSRKERISALKELKSQSNGYLSSLTLETTQTDAARKSLDAYNSSLFQSALVKAYRGEIEKLAENYAKAKDFADQGKKALDDFDASIARYKKSISDRTISGKDLLDIGDKEVENSKRRNSLIQTTNGYVKQQNALYDQIVSKGKQLGDLEAAINPFSKSSNKAPAGQTVESVLKTLSEELTSIDALAGVTGASLDSVAKDKVASLQKAFEDLVKLGLTPASPQLRKVGDDLDAMSDKILGSTTVTSALAAGLQKGITTQRANKPFLGADDVAAILGIDSQSALPVAVKIAPQIDIQTTPSLNTSLADAQSQFQTRIKNYKAQLEAQITGVTKEINEMVETAAQDGIASLAEGVGKALVSGNIGDALGGFISTISGFLEQLGKLLIVQGIAVEAFKTSLASFQGIGAVVAGAALIAASAAFRALASKGVNSYATGGIVTSPQLALIGDNPGRKEAVIPSEMFDQIGGGMDNLELTTKIKGNDIYAIVRRVGREFNRFN